MPDSIEERIMERERELERLKQRSEDLLDLTKELAEKLDEARHISKNLWTDWVQVVSVRGPYPVAPGQQMPFPCPGCNSSLRMGEMVYTLGIKATADHAGKYDVTALVSFHQQCWDASDDNFPLG